VPGNRAFEVAKLVHDDATVAPLARQRMGRRSRFGGGVPKCTDESVDLLASRTVERFTWVADGNLVMLKMAHQRHGGVSALFVVRARVTRERVEVSRSLFGAHVGVTVSTIGIDLR